jgi:hypothetical protein
MLKRKKVHKAGAYRCGRRPLFFAAVLLLSDSGQKWFILVVRPTQGV